MELEKSDLFFKENVGELSSNHECWGKLVHKYGPVLELSAET